MRPAVTRRRTEREAARQVAWAAVARADRARGWALLALAALGTTVAAYLTWVHFSGGIVLCAGSFNCEQVQASRYATAGGVPVALFGLGLYVGLLGLALWRLLAGRDTLAWVIHGLFGLAVAGTLYSAYLTYLELFVIGAICLWCVGSAAILAALLVLVLWDIRALEQPAA